MLSFLDEMLHELGCLGGGHRSHSALILFLSILRAEILLHAEDVSSFFLLERPLITFETPYALLHHLVADVGVHV